MKFTSIIFTASESILEIYLTYTHKRARIMKFASIIFTASGSILEIYLTYTPDFSIHFTKKNFAPWRKKKPRPFFKKPFWNFKKV